MWEIFFSLFKKKEAGGLLDKELLASLISGISDGVIVTDDKTNTIVCNKAVSNIAHVAKERLLDRPVGEVLRFLFDGKDITDQIFSQNQFSEEVHVQPSGSGVLGIVVVRLTVSSIERGGEKFGWVILMRDIRLERQLEEMQFGFVSIAAHELRTPLTAIKGSLSVLLSDYNKDLSQDQLALLTQIGINTDRLLILVENLLNVSRIERGAIEFFPTSVDWVLLVKQIVDDFLHRAVEKGITLTFVPPPEPITLIRVDKIRIGEVVANLLSNAVAYTKPQGTITVTVEKKDKEVWTSVADTGAGIAQEAIPNLFTKFYRANQGLMQSKNEHGTGLGLYISKAIVEMHKGRIWVASELGRGSTFTFALPL